MYLHIPIILIFSNQTKLAEQVVHQLVETTSLPVLPVQRHQCVASRSSSEYQRFLVIFVALPCRNILCVVLYLPFQDAPSKMETQTYLRVRDDWRWSAFDAFYMTFPMPRFKIFHFKDHRCWKAALQHISHINRAAFGSLDEACDPNLAIKLDCLKIISLEQKWKTLLVRTSVTSVKWPT